MLTRMMSAGALAAVMLVAGAREVSAATAPAWSLETPAGESVRYDPSAGEKPAVMLFWATWCPYCRALMPHIQQVYEAYRDRGVAVYAINIWEDSDPVAYMEQEGYTYTLLLDGDPVAEDYGVQGTPGLFVAGPDGEVLYTRRSGAEPEDVEANIRAALDSALEAQ